MGVRRPRAARKKLVTQLRSSDPLAGARRSAVMRRIRAKDTAPELAVRRVLSALGFRYRLHVRALPGHPDIVLSRHSTIVNVNGCFWHAHRCQKGRVPRTNASYWVPKLTRTKLRDRRNVRALRQRGWRVVLLWECQIKRAIRFGSLELLIASHIGFIGRD
jgi:DNA mismatch endonuclease (patch repair protein)